jgi:phosphoribosylamine---glycine ligase
MNILIIGSGGREHAFAWKISQSKHCNKLYVAPGNVGTADIAINIELDVNDFKSIGAFCLDSNIELILVGPEVPLVNGIRDFFENSPSLKHIMIVGPGKAGAKLEGSKDFSKQFMLKHGIPTAQSKTFDFNSLDEALSYIETCNFPIVLKADGLAAGKGVIIAEDKHSAIENTKDMLQNKRFGDASAKVLVEEFLNWN